MTGGARPRWGGDEVPRPPDPPELYLAGNRARPEEVTLQPMSPPAVAILAAGHFDAYVLERVRAGESLDQARQVARQQWELYLPGGQPAPGHRYHRVLEAGRAVGWLWIGPSPLDREGAEWIFNLQIDEPEQGRGLGRLALALAEADARDHGASELGLNVFGHNEVALRLYESAGFQAASINMVKTLAEEP